MKNIISGTYFNLFRFYIFMGKVEIDTHCSKMTPLYRGVLLSYRRWIIACGRSERHRVKINQELKKQVEAVLLTISHKLERKKSLPFPTNRNERNMLDQFWKGMLTLAMATGMAEHQSLNWLEDVTFSLRMVNSGWGLIEHQLTNESELAQKASCMILKTEIGLIDDLIQSLEKIIGVAD